MPGLPVDREVSRIHAEPVKVAYSIVLIALVLEPVVLASPSTVHSSRTPMFRQRHSWHSKYDWNFKHTEP
jgi:hypothetical protein